MLPIVRPGLTGAGRVAPSEAGRYRLAAATSGPTRMRNTNAEH